MAILEINIPDEFIFETKIDIRISDINYGKHVGHDAFISILHEARVRFLHHFGFTETNIDGKGIVISDIAVIYKSQSFHGDTLTIKMAVTDFNKYGFDVFYQVSHSQNKTLVLKAKTGIVFFDYSENTIVQIPDTFQSKWKSFNWGADK
ncbi:MAG: thioesterase family protein [Pseudomonadota bacterium]